VLTVLPVILIYIVAQRWILSGVSAGAVKGWNRALRTHGAFSSGVRD